MDKRIENVALISMAAISVIVAVADFVGLLHSIPWLSERIPALLLVFLAAIAGYLSLERRSKLDQIDSTTAELAETIAELENRYSQINAFFNIIQHDDPYERLGLVYSLQSIAEFRSERMITVDREHVLKLWRDCVAASTHWFTTSYIRPEAAWDTGWADTVAQAITRERMATGGKIDRIFIVDEQDEYERLRPLIQVQEDIGVQVRWIMKDELLQNKVVARYVEDLGTLDITVANDSWVFRIYLDANRDYTHMTGVRDAQVLERAKFILNQAFNRGRIPSEPRV